MKNIEHKWRKQEDGSPVSDRCPVCKTEKEDRRHYDYDCKSMQVLIDRIQERLGESITRSEWNLQPPQLSPPPSPSPSPSPPLQPLPQPTMMTEMKAIMIAKARWIHHKERCKLANNGRRRMNIDLVMQKLEQALKLADINI